MTHPYASKASQLAADATLIEAFDSPWSASLLETDDGQIVYLSDGDDSEVYQNRTAAIAAQSQWTTYATSDKGEEQAWAAMGQQIIDALS